MFTQSVRLDQAEAMVRDLIATWDQVLRDCFDGLITLTDDWDDDAAFRWNVPPSTFHSLRLYQPTRPRGTRTNARLPSRAGATNR